MYFVVGKGDGIPAKGSRATTSRAGKKNLTGKSKRTLRGVSRKRKRVSQSTLDMMAATYSGRAYSVGFPKNEREVLRYNLLQNLLRNSADVSTTRYARRYTVDLLQKLEVRTIEQTDNISDAVQRGLFLREDADPIEPGDTVCPYEGRLITSQEEFDKVNPLQGEGEVCHLYKRYFEQVGFDRDGLPVVMIKDCPYARQRDIVHMQGTVTGMDQKGQAIIALTGHREARHTLVLGDGVFIDGAVPASAAAAAAGEGFVENKKYILGVGALANSADPVFGDERENNCKYRRQPGKLAGFIEATDRISPGDEILVDYDQI